MVDYSNSIEEELKKLLSNIYIWDEERIIARVGLFFKEEVSKEIIKFWQIFPTSFTKSNVVECAYQYYMSDEYNYFYIKKADILNNKEQIIPKKIETPTGRFYRLLKGK